MAEDSFDFVAFFHGGGRVDIVARIGLLESGKILKVVCIVDLDAARGGADLVDTGTLLLLGASTVLRV